MLTPTPRGRSILFSGFLASFAIACIIALVFQFGGIRLNTSSSLPIGFYGTTLDKSAKLIEFCPAEPFASLSALRGYRGRGGGCPDGREPLMKPVVAVAGDSIEISSRGFAVNGFLLPNSAARCFDSKSRSLPQWPLGRFRVTVGTVWVISSFNPRSFDSRYFGPIPISAIRCHLRPILIE